MRFPKPNQTTKKESGVKKCRARQITESSCGAMEWESRLKSTGDHGRVGTCRNWPVCWIPSQFRCALARKEGSEAPGTPRNPADRDPRHPSTTHYRAQGPGAQCQGQGFCRPTENSMWPPFLFLFPVPMERPVVIAKSPGPQ